MKWFNNFWLYLSFVWLAFLALFYQISFLDQTSYSRSSTLDLITPSIFWSNSTTFFEQFEHQEEAWIFLLWFHFLDFIRTSWISSLVVRNNLYITKRDNFIYCWKLFQLFLSVWMFQKSKLKAKYSHLKRNFGFILL